jgi:hypothetical protein
MSVTGDKDGGYYDCEDDGGDSCYTEVRPWYCSFENTFPRKTAYIGVFIPRLESV